MKKWWLVILCGLSLVGCMHTPREPARIDTIRPGTSATSQDYDHSEFDTPDLNSATEDSFGEDGFPSGVVPTPPRLASLDWSGSMTPMIQSLFSSLQSSDKGVLFIDSVKNNTNGSLQTTAATSALYSALSTNPILRVIPSNTAQQGEQALGLSPNDSLVTLSKAMGVARYLKADYLLFTKLTGSVKSPKILMQLLSVKSGELVWSGSGTTQLTN